jgi:long-chain acyl-CoA synthetase
MNEAEQKLKSRIHRHEIGLLLESADGNLKARPAIWFSGVSLSYGDLQAAAHSMASGLLERGLKPGQRVATLLPNCLEIYQLYFGTAAARGIFMPLNRDFAAAEIAHMVGQAKPRFMVTCSELQPRLDQALALVGAKPEVLLIDENLPHGRRLACLEAPGTALPAVDPEDVVLISYTSGSTSNPKAIAFSHRVELDGARLYEDAWGVTARDKVLICMSLGWTYGMNPGSFPELRAGGSIVLLEKFHPMKVLQAIQDHEVTIFKGVPTMYAMMLAHVEETGMRYDLSSLRLALCAGAGLPQTVADRFKAAFGIGLTNFFGISEVKLVASPRVEDDLAVPRGSVGKPPPGVQVRVVDEKKRDVPRGETGELLVRSIGWMTGYFLEPDRTHACNPDGWYISGDLVRMDRDGFIYPVGRSREQIVRGGAKVAPAEVEKVLMDHPAISLAAVIGTPDPIFGEAVKALVLPKDNSLSAADILAYCEGKLAPFKIPTVIELVASLPIGPTGKVQKKLLQ